MHRITLWLIDKKKHKTMLFELYMYSQVQNQMHE